MKMQYVLLGSGAVRPNPRRAGPSQAIILDDRILMFDCGPGAARSLASTGLAPQCVEKLFLTHLHFDHTADCPYLALVGWTNGRKTPLEVFGPAGTSDFIEKGIRGTFGADIATRLAHGKDPSGIETQTTEISGPGECLREDDLSVSAIFTQHAHMDTLVFAVEARGRRAVVVGDTILTNELVEFCRGADLIAVECSGTSEFLQSFAWGAWHMTPQDVANLAKRSKAGRVLLKHFVMEDITGELDCANRLAAMVREGFDGEVLAGYDGLKIDMSG